MTVFRQVINTDSLASASKGWAWSHHPIKLIDRDDNSLGGDKPYFFELGGQTRQRLKNAGINRRFRMLFLGSQGPSDTNTDVI